MTRTRTKYQVSITNTMIYEQADKDNHLFTSGKLEFRGNSNALIGGSKRCSVGYVTQEDFLLPNLTVRETLMFIAKLKISPERLNSIRANYKRAAASNSTWLEYTDESSNESVYSRIVQEVIMDLGLKECADNFIGSDDLAHGNRRGISGGEKRRVSVATQILTDPQGN